MLRTLSVVRRRANLVDTIVPFVYGVAAYRLKWQTNFDAAYTQFIDSSNVGFLDPAVNQATLDVQQTQGRVRIVFNPTTYSIPDASQFWLSLFHVAAGGAETQISAPSLVLPELSHHGIHQVTIQGEAPIGADSAHALQLDLPRQMHDFRIHNDEAPGGNIMYVSTVQDGPEAAIKPEPTTQFTSLAAAQSTLWIRAGIGAVTFSAIFTTAAPK